MINVINDDDDADIHSVEVDADDDDIVTWSAWRPMASISSYKYDEVK